MPSKQVNDLAFAVQRVRTSGERSAANGTPSLDRALHLWLVVLLAFVLPACTTLPTTADYRGAVSPSGIGSTVVDGRPRFRAIFCHIAAESAVTLPGDPGCDDLLWRLRDEGESGSAAALPTATGKALRLLIVAGAFNDCLGEEALPFRAASLNMITKGYDIEGVDVSGRSSPLHNAATLAATLRARSPGHDGKIVLLGYSKGTVDILETLLAYPELAVHVAAVISVASPIFGSPLAAEARWLYDSLFTKLAPDRCDPGDGGVIDSLLPETRRQWMEAHRLPGGIRFYSVAALPHGDRVARTLRPAWRWLSRTHRLNDGQVTARDALIPGSTLLAYPNADHWGIALQVEHTLPRLAGRKDSRAFPQQAFLEALLAYVDEDLQARGDLVAPPPAE